MKSSLSAKCKQRQRSAFSLVELIVVIVIVGLIAGMLTIRWTGMLSPISAATAVDRVLQFDRSIRQFAKTRHVSGKLYFEKEENELIGQFETEPPTYFRQKVPNAVEFSGLQFQKPTEDLNVVLFARNGVSETYSIKLQTDGITYTIQFAGLTGQPVVDEN